MEHLKEPLHVLIQVEDARNRAEARLKFAIKQVKKMLIPAVRTPKMLPIVNTYQAICYCLY